MGLLPESGNPADVNFFKIDEATYDPKTMTWGTDWLMKNKNIRDVTIPSDIKPGTYVVRHEIISLHNALNDDYIKKSSGAQFYPQCVKVKVTGEGTATPPGSKFPGTYKWDEKGILVNIFYRPNEYVSPGPALYKPAVVQPPEGPQPPTSDTPVSAAYQQAKAKADQRWQGAVHSTDAARTYIGRDLTR
jgi:cellulase